MDTKKQLKTQNPQINTEQTINISAGEVADARLYHNVPLSQLDIDMVEHKNPSLASKVKGFFANALSRLGLSTTSDVTEIELEDFGGPVNAQQIERLNDRRLIDGDMSQIRLSETIPIEGRTVSSNLPTASNVTAVKTSPEIKKIELNPVVPITQEQKEYTYYQTHNCQTMASDMKACADSYADIAEAKKALVKMVRKDENGSFISELDQKNAEWNDALKNREEDEIIKDVLGEIRLYLFTNKSTLGFFSDYIECPERFHRMVNIVSYLSTKANILPPLQNEMVSVMKDQIKNSVIFYKQSYNLDILKDSPLENDPEFRNLKANKKQAANLHSTALKNTTTIREKLDEEYSKKKTPIQVGDKKVELEQGHILTEANIYENSITDDQNYAHVINNPAYFESIEHKSVYGNTDNEEIIPEHAKKDSKLSKEDKKNAATLCDGIVKSLDTIESYAKNMQLFSSDAALNKFLTCIKKFRSDISILKDGKPEQKDTKEAAIPASIKEDKYFTDQTAASKISSAYAAFTDELRIYFSSFNSNVKRLGMPNVTVKANYEALQSFIKEETLLTQIGNLFSIAQMQMSLNSPELKKHYFLDKKKLEYIIKSDVKNNEQWPIPESDKAIQIITGNSAYEKAWLIAKLLIKEDAESVIRKAILDTYSSFSFTEKNNICRWLCIIQDELTIDTTEIFEAPELELSIKQLKATLVNEKKEEKPVEEKPLEKSQDKQEKQDKTTEKTEEKEEKEEREEKEEITAIEYKGEPIGDVERTVPVARKDIKLTEFGHEEDSWAYATALMLQNYGYIITPKKVKDVVSKAISEKKISADVGRKISKDELVTLDDIKGAFASVFGNGVLQEIDLANYRNPVVHGKNIPMKEKNARIVKDTIREAFKNDCVVVMYVDGHYITITDYKNHSKDEAFIRYQDSRKSGHDEDYPEFSDEITKKLSSLFGESEKLDYASIKLYWMKKEQVTAPVTKEEEPKEKKEKTQEKVEKVEKKTEEQKDILIEPEKSAPAIQLPNVYDLKYTEFQKGNDCWAYTISLQLKARGYDMTPGDVKKRIIEAIESKKIPKQNIAQLDMALLNLRELLPLFEAELGGKDKIHAFSLVNYKESAETTLEDVTKAAGEDISMAINLYHSPVSMYFGEHYVTVTAIQKEPDGYVVHYQDSLLNHHNYDGEKDPSHDNVEKLSHLIEHYTSEKGSAKVQAPVLFWADNDEKTLQFISDNAMVRETL